jgi:hypothetical protein
MGPFTVALERLGIEWKRSNRNYILIAQSESVTPGRVHGTEVLIDRPAPRWMECTRQAGTRGTIAVRRWTGARTALVARSRGGDGTPR